jgi:hypothetical protein
MMRYVIMSKDYTITKVLETVSEIKRRGFSLFLLGT